MIAAKNQKVYPPLKRRWDHAGADVMYKKGSFQDSPSWQIELDKGRGVKPDAGDDGRAFDVRESELWRIITTVCRNA